MSRGDTRFVGLPVFPSRNFRHGYLFIGTPSGIERPEDLRGKRVGIHEYQMTAGVWIRAFLQHDYDVHARDLRWFTGGLYSPGYVARAPIALPDDIDLQVIPEDRHLEEMLECGDLDALVSPLRPQSLRAGTGSVRRLFPDYRSVEKDYFRRTGVFPIMHLVVMRRAVYEANPWIAVSLYEAFEAAKREGRKRLVSTSALAVALPWIPADLEEIADVFGDRDPWVYGVDANRNVLEALAQYSFEQGLATRRVSVEELFAKETLVVPAIRDDPRRD